MLDTTQWTEFVLDSWFDLLLKYHCWSLMNFLLEGPQGQLLLFAQWWGAGYCSKTFTSKNNSLTQSCHWLQCKRGFFVFLPCNIHACFGTKTFNLKSTCEIRSICIQQHTMTAPDNLMVLFSYNRYSDYLSWGIKDGKPLKWLTLSPESKHRNKK